jgi:hypothetical protein
MSRIISFSTLATRLPRMLGDTWAVGIRYAPTVCSGQGTCVAAQMTRKILQ